MKLFCHLQKMEQSLKSLNTLTQKLDNLNNLSKFINIDLIPKINHYKKTLTTCHSTVGTAIVNTSITIVFGFSILVMSNFIPTIYFGVFTGIAMLLAMVSVLTLLPSLLLKIKPFN